MYVWMSAFRHRNHTFRSLELSKLEIMNGSHFILHYSYIECKYHFSTESYHWLLVSACHLQLYSNGIGNGPIIIAIVHHCSHRINFKFRCVEMAATIHHANDWPCSPFNETQTPAVIQQRYCQNLWAPIRDTSPEHCISAEQTVCCIYRSSEHNWMFDKMGAWAKNLAITVFRSQPSRWWWWCW